MGGETRDKTPVTRTAEARSTSGRNNESLNKVHKGKGVAEDTAEETIDRHPESKSLKVVDTSIETSNKYAVLGVKKVSFCEFETIRYIPRNGKDDIGGRMRGDRARTCRHTSTENTADKDLQFTTSSAEIDNAEIIKEIDRIELELNQMMLNNQLFLSRTIPQKLSRQSSRSESRGRARTPAWKVACRYAAFEKCNKGRFCQYSHEEKILDEYRRSRSNGESTLSSLSQSEREERIARNKALPEIPRGGNAGTPESRRSKARISRPAETITSDPMGEAGPGLASGLASGLSSSRRVIEREEEDTPKAAKRRREETVSQDEIKETKQRVITIKGPKFRNINLLHINLRGFLSKKETLLNIINEKSVKIVLINETHAPEFKPPKLKGFNSYARARVNKRMGGVAVLVHHTIDDGAVLVEVGEGDNEYVAVKLETFSPPLVLFSQYGQQENQHGDGVIAGNLAEVIEKAREYSEQGCDLVWCGDLNIKIGNEESGLHENDPAVSKGGKFLLEALKETDMELCNSLHKGKGHTHFDATTNTSRVLDYVISNIKQKFVHFEIDDNCLFTPYRVRVSRDKLDKTKRCCSH